MLQCRSELLQIASCFTGAYDPCRCVCFEPAASGGVLAMATDRASAVWIHDARGQLDQPSVLVLPDAELIKACRGLRSSRRTLVIDGAAARVITDYKAHSKGVDVPLQDPPAQPFPPLASVLKAAIDRWGTAPSTASSCGRFDVNLLKRVLEATGSDGSVVLAGMDGGPLRLQCQDLEVVALLMPQQREPIPPLPQWLVAAAT